MTTQPVLAADIGGTQMRAALVDPQGRILHRQTVPTPAQADVPASLTDLIAAVAAMPDHGAPSHAVVGLPGAVDYTAGRLLWAPNLPKQWPAQLSAESLSAHLGLPVNIANDADLAAVGEATFGAGAGSDAVAYLTISTGIGAGVVFDGRLVRGAHSLAELGHVVVDWRGWRDGAPCTVEDLGSGGGVARMASAAGLGTMRAHEVHARAEAGEPPRRRRVGAGHCRLCCGRLQPGHVLLPEHGRHRRWHGPPGRLLRAVTRHGSATPPSPSRRPDDCPFAPR